MTALTDGPTSAPRLSTGQVRKEKQEKRQEEKQEKRNKRRWAVAYVLQWCAVACVVVVAHEIPM